MKAPKKRYVVEMGQGYRYNLPTALKNAGATNVSVARLDPSSTLVRVSASYAGSADDLQKMLWAQFPAASVGVEEAKR